MILHIAQGDRWRAALISGTYDGGVSDLGFIHCSTGRQVRTPWRTLFARVPDLVMLLIDAHALEAPVRYEPATAGEDAFPHVYGTIPASAVVAAEPIEFGMVEALSLPAPMARLLAAARGDSPPGIDEWRHLEYTISTDRTRLDIDCLHEFLSREAYWSVGIPRDVLEKALSNSLCFGLFAPAGDQAGFCRVVTDHATYGYLADVFVLPEHRGLGLGHWLVQCALDHPDLAGLRSWTLGTRDAHALYERFGWSAADPSRWMSRSVPATDIYR
jgi:uncharacterized protein (DUF952 family)/N-acetylglutamate synthase-like GNAT family acetyltransferase